jgi:hypothetical protein
MTGLSLGVHRWRHRPFASIGFSQFKQVGPSSLQASPSRPATPRASFASTASIRKTPSEAVKRSEDRLPLDFPFRLTGEEVTRLRSQFVTSNEGRAESPKRAVGEGQIQPGRGKVTQKADPDGPVERSVSSAPICRASSLLIARPNPEPSGRVLTPGSKRCF